MAQAPPRQIVEEHSNISSSLNMLTKEKFRKRLWE